MSLGSRKGRRGKKSIAAQYSFNGFPSFPQFDLGSVSYREGYLTYACRKFRKVIHLGISAVSEVSPMLLGDKSIGRSLGFLLKITHSSRKSTRTNWTHFPGAFFRIASNVNGMRWVGLKEFRVSTWVGTMLTLPTFQYSTRSEQNVEIKLCCYAVEPLRTFCFDRFHMKLT